MRNILFLLFTAFLTYVDAHAQNDRMMVKAYWHGRISQLDSFDVKKLTHIIFCFGHLEGQRYKIDDAEDSAMIRKMTTLKTKNPQLKVILSLGGWGGCETCSDAFFTAEGRETFVRSVKEVNDYFGTDGIDLDWEYPTVRLDNDIDTNPVHKTAPEDRANFTDLVRRLRYTLGKKATITFAAGGFQTYLEKAVDWHEVMKEVDYVNIMSYDLINGYATETGHHAALYSTPKQRESTDNAVQFLLKSGVDARKIIIGAAFYARTWENVPPANNGLYQQGKFKSFIPYRDFPERLSPDQGYRPYWDDTAKAPYLYNAAQRAFATFDDKRSIEIKTRYVTDHGLGGIMFWELSLDTHTNGLLDVIDNTRKNYKPSKK